MGKFNLDKIVGEVRKLYEKNKDIKVGTGESLRGIADNDFLVMPPWWQQATNTKGLPLGRIVMIAGDSDSGKTSAAIQAMKAAQEQGFAVLYVETEAKTTKKDLEIWGVDTSQIMLVQSCVAEVAFQHMYELWDSFFEQYPKDRLLVVFDSLGNTVSRHDEQLDLAEDNQKPGGKGKANRIGINRMVAKLHQSPACVLILNYTYDNIGAPGKTNAGGKAVNFFSCLTYQTSRKQWLEQTVKGVKIRIGAVVQWKLFKNHIDKSNPGPKVIELLITKEGVKYAGEGQ